MTTNAMSWTPQQLTKENLPRIEDPAFFGFSKGQIMTIQRIVNEEFANGPTGSARGHHAQEDWLRVSPGGGGEAPDVHLIFCRDQDSLSSWDEPRGALYRGLDTFRGGWPKNILLYTTHWDNDSWRRAEARWRYIANEGVRWKIVLVTPYGHFRKLLKSSELPPYEQE